MHVLKKSLKKGKNKNKCIGRRRIGEEARMLGFKENSFTYLFRDV